MTEEASIGGYEFSFKCECGGVIVEKGMSFHGPRPDYEFAIPEGEQQLPIKDGSEYTCQWCNREYTIEFNVKE